MNSLPLELFFFSQLNYSDWEPPFEITFIFQALIDLLVHLQVTVDDEEEEEEVVIIYLFAFTQLVCRLSFTHDPGQSRLNYPSAVYFKNACVLVERKLSTVPMFWTQDTFMIRVD